MKDEEAADHDDGNRKRKKAKSGTNSSAKMVKSTQHSPDNENSDEDSANDLDDYTRIRRDEAVEAALEDADQDDQESDASSLDENAVYHLGAMDRFKVSQAAKRGKAEAKRELAAAMERNEAAAHAFRLGAEKRKGKDKVIRT